MSSSSVTSQTWLQNFRPHVNGVRVRWPDLYLSLVAGECINLTLEFEYSYLIGDPESPLKLCCEPDAEPLGLECDPPFGQLVEMKEGLIELTWHICARKTSGARFGLHFEMPLYQGMPPSPLVPGKIEDVLIDSLRCDRPATYVGYEVNAQALVLSSPSGRPVPGVTVNWTYAGRPLLDSTSDKNGIAPSVFTVTDIGEHDLEVSMAGDTSSPKIQRIVVKDQLLAVITLEVDKYEVPVGKSLEVRALLQSSLTQEPMEGVKVDWEYRHYGDDVSYSNALGRTSTCVLATQEMFERPPLYIWAHVHGPNFTVSKRMTLLVVSNANT